MLHAVEKRADGSYALMIDGDLQFDSSDEHIYHETLVLPALAVAHGRNNEQLRILVIGGGDGLVARELLKSASVRSVDLVDYDADIVALAHLEFADLNGKSLSDPRMSIHIMDAWKFVEDAVAGATRYHLIVVDLTVADTIEAAKFHSIEWYANLKELLGTRGILAVNTVSPQKTPEAFWSIFNSQLSGGLYPRACRVVIPSFVARGYGADWAFLLSGVTEISSDELNASVLSEPRTVLRDLSHVRDLFQLPEDLLAVQSKAAPARAGSDILLHYFRNNTPLEMQSKSTIDSFCLDVKILEVPEPESGVNLLPPELRVALAEHIHAAGLQLNEANEPALVEKVLALLPALHQFHTPEIISDFVANPETFLQAIDIAGLVERLLARAAELPEHLVEELKHLNEKLQEWCGDYLSLVSLGERVIAILTLVVVVGNFMYPDAAYGKGEHHGAGGHRGMGRDARGFDRNAGRGDRGFDGARRGAFSDYGRGYGGYRGYWGHHWGAWGWSRPYSGFYWGGYVPPVYYGGSNWSTSSTTNNQYVDETGTSYPAPSYNYSNTVVNLSSSAGAQQAGQKNAQALNTQAIYKLADGADILPSGNIAIPLTNQAFLMPTSKGTQLIDQSNGQPIISLYNDPALLYQSAVEMKRQHHRLENLIKKANNNEMEGGTAVPAARLALMQRHAGLLQNALQNLGPIPPNPPGKDAVAPMVPGGTELFASVWMTPDGKYLAVKRSSGQMAYLGKDGWYSDLGRTKMHIADSPKLRTVATSFMSKMVSEADATKNMLLQDNREGTAHLDMLQRELSDYQSAMNAQPDDMVDYGTRKMKRSEAERLTSLAIARTQNKLHELQQRINAMPNELQLAQKELASLGGSSS